MHEITLTWNGPYEFTSRSGRSVFDSPVATSGGLYVWAVQTPSGYLIHYAGETGASFARRHYAHFCEYTCGAYTIHDPKSFAAGRRAPLYTGFTYPKERWRRAQPFIDDFATIAPAMAEMIGLLRLFLAPLDTDQRTRRRIEGALSLLLSQGDAELREFQGRKARWLRRDEEEPIRVRSLIEHTLRGVPSVFEA